MSINSFGSIYGPGILNDTIVPGYGITKFPINLGTFWSLPNGTTRNFGEATQYVTYPVGRPNWMYQLGHNFMSPNHISQWNPMLIGTGINLNTDTTNPYLSQAGQMSAYQWGANLAMQMQIQQAVQGIAGALNSMESSLTSILKSDKLTNAQKATLKGLLEEVIALKEKIAKQLKAKNPSQEEVAAMQQEVMDLQKKVSDAADKIRAEVSEGGDSSSSSSSSSSSNSDNSDLSGTDYENIDTETGKPNSLTTPSDSEVDQFCAVIFRAVDCSCGTKDEELEAAISGLNENNIIEIVKNWEENYGQHTEKGNAGFFARILDDIDDDDQKKYVPIMLNALSKRAEALGIYDEIKQEIATVNKELSYDVAWYAFNWFGGQNDHKIANALMSIYNKIAEKEKANKDGAKTSIDNKKSQRKTEVETEKKNEIALKLKETLKLKNTPALAAGLKIETDDNGEFTGYAIEINTNNGKVKVTGATYQELALAIERQGLKVEDVLIRKTQA